MLASRIPDIVSIGPPASSEQIDELASALGVELPEQYRTLLREANGIIADTLQIYSVDQVPERNRTYDVAQSLPGYFVIGTVHDFPVLLRAGHSSPVFENSWGSMSASSLKELALGLCEWIDAGCPDSTGDADDD